MINCHFPKNNEDLIEILCFIKSPPIILGGLSNILLSEDFIDYPSFISLKHYQSINPFNANSSLTSLKIANLSGIPGTLGGAIVSNAGAYGSSIADFIQSVDVLDLSDLTFKTLDKSDCNFSYRNSIFKQTNNYIILSAKLDYTPSTQDEIQKVLEIRRQKGLYKEPSLGSFFKNPQGQFAGKLLEDANLKGFVYQNAKVSDFHANVLTNPDGKATAKEIYELSKICRETIKKLYNINIEYEVVLYGFNNEQQS